MPGLSLIEHFAAEREPRQSWKGLFPLAGVLLVVLCGTLAGAEDFVEIQRSGQVHQDVLRRLPPYTAGMERRYYISSLPLDAKLRAHAVRCHWHVETACTGCSMSFSTSISAACDPMPGHRTWLPFATSP